jgi:hypothetical protein
VGFHRGQAGGALRSLAGRASQESGVQHPSGYWKARSTGTGNPDLFGGPSTRLEPGQQSPAQGQDPRPSRGRPAKLFGASQSAPRWSRAAGALRSAGQPVPRVREPAALRSCWSPSLPGPGNRSSSEHRAPSLTRGQADGSLRRAASRTSPRPRRRHSSESREQRFNGLEARLIGMSPPPLGAGPRCSPEHRTPPPGIQATGTLRSADDRVPLRAALLGAWSSRGSAHGTLRSVAGDASPGPGRRHSSESREPNLTGAAQTALFGGPRATPHRDMSPPLFGVAASGLDSGQGTSGLSGPGNRSSSEPRTPSLDGAARTALFGGPRATLHPGKRQPELLGASEAASHRGRDSRALRSPAAPVSSRSRQLISIGKSVAHTPPGAGPVDHPGQGQHGCTLSHFGGGCGRQGHRLMSAPTPGRTVTAGRQGPQ